MSQIPVTNAEDHHAILMNRMYRTQRHIYDLTRKYYLFGRDTTISNLDLAPGASLLEVGCGTGRNLAVTHRLFPKTEMMGIDISQEMLNTARGKLAAKGIFATLKEADATDFKASDFGRSGFDRIMISYALSMIPDWQAALDTAIAALASSGQLHIIDFGQQENLPHAFALLLRSWLNRFHVTPRAKLREAVEERAALNGGHVRFQSIGKGYAWRFVYTRLS